MVAIVVICNLTNFYVTQVLRHLHVSHNAPYLPPKSWHNLCFSFLLNITAAPREIILKTMLVQNFVGQITCIIWEVCKGILKEIPS